MATNYDLAANLSSSNGALFYSDSGGTTSASSVTFSSGTATVYLKFVNGGSQTITATDQTTKSIAGSAGTFVTVPDPVTQYAMILNPMVVSGSPTTVEIKAEDADGFVVRNYTTPSDFLLTSLTTTAATAQLPSSITFVNGIATFQATFTLATGTTFTAESLTATDSRE